MDISKSDSLDLVKLRLRGRGSGYKEGNIQEGIHFFDNLYYILYYIKKRIKRPPPSLCKFEIL